MAKKYRKSNRKRSKRAKTDMRTILVTAIILAGAWVVNSLIGCDNPEEVQIVRNEGAYGDLMKVVTNPAVPSQLKSYKGMDISFNEKCHIPNWVSWELTDEETMGDVPRKDKFTSDPDIEGCPDSWDYSYSGYDRGHMAPAGDMKWDSKAMEETFFMSNICPQVNALNTGAWKNLEEKCRLWAQIDGRIYIVCGPIIDEKPMELIGDSRVWVPSRFFKAIIAPYSNPARGIGFIMPNEKVKGGMQPCAVTIDEIERITGHDLFPALPDDIEAELESQCNFNQWSTLKKKN
ncbi:DNA/RNA non-specific endonuclease [uncultured Duncaniella sp.]|uniref:DNA/RNA non-specific endonuclease n=1 Tax=uncultured Duncaniella sp. TaxID=2768039 RepID=UPI0026756248|nr:DNA/RNA non-specific endonuclease [uncultured Duncaniella sp.]MCI9172167.1 DNA/RNA non-specific endonuclease [Muribaculaceae bacterium]